MPEIPQIEIMIDESHRSIQPIMLAKNILEILGLKYQRDYTFDGGRNIKVSYVNNVASAKKIIISCGIETVEDAIKAKDSSTFLVSVLDPTKHHKEFDLIIVPEHDPKPQGDNVITTIGLMNHITPELLSNISKARFNDFPSPRIAVLVGGKHVGGNVSEEDAKQIAELASSLGNSVMVTTSQRTENKTAEALKASITKPMFFWDYNHEGQAANPYLSILAAADIIIVTADSVRMCSEAASTGKPVKIFEPKKIHFSYQALADSLKNQQGLNEAKRIAAKIMQLLEAV